MNLDSLSFALSQISYSVANLTKKNYKANITEISTLVEQYGPEADRHLFRCLFSHVDFSGDGRSSGKDFHQTQYLIQECATLIAKPNFVSILCYALDNPLHQQKSLRPSAHLFSQLSKVLKLTSVQEIAFGLAAFSSSNSETHRYAVQFVRQKLPQLLNSYIDTDCGSGEGGGLQDTPIEVVHLLLSHLLSPADSDSLGVSSEQKDAFFRTLTKDFPRDRVPVVLAPLLYPETLDLPVSKLGIDSTTLPFSMSTSLADMLLELGHNVTKSLDQCRSTLKDLGASQLTAAFVARVIGMMTRHPSTAVDHTSLQSLLVSGGGRWTDSKDGTESASSTSQSASSWNIDIFVDVVKELAPNLVWNEVVKELDYTGFQIVSRAGFELLIRGLSRGLSEAFPVEVLYSLWKNKEGQLSWLVYSLKNSDIFCLADFPHRTVVMDALKSLPDDENKDITVWKSLDLIDVLLQLADEGFQALVLELFKFPMQYCPDLLLLGLLQISRWANLKKELLSTIIPMFLSNHPNSVPVLQAAWHCASQSHNVRSLVLHAMAEWYMRGELHDQARLSRILDVAQDLKALSLLLNATPYAFVIDLACLASRREYLKLDKWLTDKIREHGEPFVQACASFLVVRCPQLVGKEDQTTQSKSHQLPAETIGTMLACLQACCASLSPELQEDIIRVLTNGNLLLKAAKQFIPGIAGLGPRTGLSQQQIAGLPAGLNSQIDPLSGVNPVLNAVAMAAANNPAAVGGVGGYPGSLAASLSATAPGSPARNFSQLGQIAQPQGPASQQPGFPGLTAALSSQLQGLSLHSGLGSTGLGPSIGTGLGTGFGGGGLGGGSGLGANSLSGGTGLAGGSLGVGASLGAAGVTGGTALGSGALGGGPGLGMGSLGGGPSLGTDSLGGSRSLGTSGLGGVAGLGSVGSGLSLPSRGAPSLGVLSAQAALAQQPSAVRPGPTTSAASQQAAGLGPQQFSKDVEDEANSYFQRIYNTSGSSQHSAITIVEQVLEMLKNFKDSPSDRDKEVFQCMLRNLFEEYRFFHQYPDKELHTTAVFFGSIIDQGLVTYMALGIALRYVLEALKQVPGKKMYMFGLTALDKFKTRLKEYPQYCQFLASIPHFAEFPTNLKEYIEYGAKSQDPPNPSTTSSVVATNALATTSVPSSASVVVSTVAVSVASTQPTHGAISRPATSAAVSTRPSVANATNIDTLLANKEGIECVKVPPENLQDKVFFIFNNLSMSNMDSKSGELMECIGEEFLPWVAQYLVMKRASIEHNFHTLYSNFIDHLKKPEFLTVVIAETYRNIKVLLRCDKGVANYSDRTLLKNLGHWLGLLTLAKNKPILFREMDVKGLIYESYHKGAQELLYVIPFVAKIIESAAKSRVFRPPNPWTMAIMNVLAELHREPDMKLNLKFEIEVLCKNLGLDINDLAPGSYLKDTSLLDRLEPQLSAPSRPAKEGSTPQPDEPLHIPMPTPAVAMGAGMPASAMPVPAVAMAPPTTHHQQPQFGFQEISGLTLTALMSHVVINEQITLFLAHPQLKSCVKQAIERAIQEMLAPAIERATKIAVTTSEQIVKKDFALDPDESRMRMAAHHLVRFMTAGMALITCHEPVLISINGQLKNAFLNALGQTVSGTQKELIEQAAQVIATDNAELATAFLQKTAVEKAIPEIEKHLTNEYELRKHARSEGRRYCDPQVLTYQAERMPEQIRLKVGGVTPQQMAVYEEFSRNIPGFIPMGGSLSGELPAGTTADSTSNTTHTAASYIVKPLPSMMGNDDIHQIYDKVSRETEQHLAAFQAAVPSAQQTAAIRTLLEYVLHARQSVRDVNPALALVQRAVEGLLDGFAVPTTGPEQELMLRYRDCHLLIIRALQDPRVHGPQWTNKHVTRCLIQCREDYRYNIEAVDLLISNQFVLMQQYDVHLAHNMENGMNYPAVVFAMQLVQRFCTDIDRLTVRAQEGDFCNTIDALSRIAVHSRQPPDGLASLLEALRQNTEGSLIDRVGIAPPPMMHSGIIQAREFDDPPGLHEKTEYLLREWVNLYHSPAAGLDSTKAFSSFVAQMHLQGILKTDDLITRFFRLCTEMCVDLCYRALSEPSQVMTRVRVQCFHTLDAFVRLIQLLLRHSGDTSNTNTKINLLNKVLGIVAGVLLQDHDVRHTDFQQLPYHRIFIMLFIELNAPEQVLESINFEVLQSFCNVLHILRPAKAPGFAYAWLELVSHRIFVGRVLAMTPQQRAWGMYATLLIDLFKFLAPFLRNAELTKPAQLLYKGTMRVLLVLLHDFPEFLCDYHYAFCDVIPPNCIQVRNLVLSAFPRNMRLPDPFTPNLKVDMLPEITHAPRVMSNFVSFIQPQSFKKEIDTYLKTRAPVTFVSELRSKLQVSSTPGMKYNIPLMNALVLYVGTQAIQYIHSKSQTPGMATIAHSSHMDIFQNLAVDMDTEGRYLFLNAVANQLRYPNSHTHYFSCTLLYLFAEANSEAIQEQITRVLLERLIVNRPHPWGLLITFIELIKNPQFKFWHHEFVHCAPEIEKLLDSVARSCMQPKVREAESADVR